MEEITKENKMVMPILSNLFLQLVDNEISKRDKIVNEAKHWTHKNSQLGVIVGLEISKEIFKKTFKHHLK